MRRAGDILWRAPLKLNPWGGPSVSGKAVVITGSTIGYAMADIKKAKGDVAAFDLADGKERWRKGPNSWKRVWPHWSDGE